MHNQVGYHKLSSGLPCGLLGLVLSNTTSESLQNFQRKLTDSGAGDASGLLSCSAASGLLSPGLQERPDGSQQLKTAGALSFRALNCAQLERHPHPASKVASNASEVHHMQAG